MGFSPWGTPKDLIRASLCSGPCFYSCNGDLVKTAIRTKIPQGKHRAPARKRHPLTSEQLQATRAIRWRQNSSPILTLEDAQAFLQQTGLCLFLPRKAQLNAAAPSFVEACLGQTNPTPPRSAIEAARELLVRLIDANQAIPLNLLGTPADHPDFLVTPDSLPFVYSMRGDRDWKHAPGSGTTRVSPLVQQIWKVIERKGVLSAGEIKDEIGRELTEAAALRALYELWGAMRIAPLYQSDGEPTLWEALQTRHHKALNAATNMSQVTALSVLVSLYLESAVAATSDETEIFLSPLTSRSKVREAVRGLTATRQLAMLPMDRETLLHVEGSLPDFEVTTASPAENATTGTTEAAARRAPRRPFAAASSEAATRPAQPRPESISIRSAKPKLPDTISVWPRPATPAENVPQELKPAAEAASTEQQPASTEAAPREHSTPRSRRIFARPRPETRSTDGPSTAPRPAASRPARPNTERPHKPAAGRSFAASAGAPRRERTPARPPWKDKGKPGFAKSPAARGEKARWPRERAPGAPPRSASPTEGERATFKPRSELRPRPDAGRFPKPTTGGFKPRGDFKDFKARKPGDFKRRSSSAEGTGARPGFKSGGFDRGARPSAGADRQAGGSRPGAEFRQPWKDNAPGRPSFRSRDAKPAGARPPFQRSGAPNRGSAPARNDRPFAGNPRSAGFKPGSKPSFKPRSSSPTGSRFAPGREGAGPSPTNRPEGGTPGQNFKPGRPAFKGGFKKPSGPSFKQGFKSGPRPPSRSASAGNTTGKPFTKRNGPSDFKGPRKSGPGGFSSRPPNRPRPGGPPRPKRKPE